MKSADREEMRREIERPRCEATVWKRDTYRRTGRTKSGFKMHYNECRCSRRSVEDGFCRQHLQMARRGWNILRSRLLDFSDMKLTKDREAGDDGK